MTQIEPTPQKTSIVPARWKFVLAVLGGIVAGFLLHWGLSSARMLQHPAVNPISQGQTSEQATVWTCSMHPQIRQPKPGKCPICFMDLIPVESSGANVAARQISFSPEALKLMEVQTSPVERKFVEADVRMVGRIAYDETRVKNITAWVPGRIDKLFVDFTGTTVRKGDHLVELYSPELLSAQSELIQAAQAVKNLKPDTSDLMKRTVESTYASARKKLQLLGLTDEQLTEIEQTAVPSDHVTIYAPIGGIVIEKEATEGMYVETGTRIYTIADLSQMWVLMDAYESDMTWLRYGQDVTFEVEAFPGTIFHGIISFIDPRLDPQTRTIKLRVNVNNPDEKLKPDMFVHAVVKAKIAEEGKVMTENLAGKWMCPMHPDVVKDKAGTCDICGMQLATTQSLGYVPIDPAQEPPLVVPASAVLMTGKRAVVYVQVPQMEKPTFEGREIGLGPRAGDYYIVRQGLSVGEVVVSNGNFKIDSAMQIQAKPSMMNPEGGAAPPMHEHGSHAMPPEAAAVPVANSDAAEQTVCPVMGDKINKEIFMEYKGKKVYFCCPECKPKFEKDPEKYLANLPQFKQ
jgi:Cu(I)/Ag(I) efflux system membrane fusion protein